MWRVTNPAIHAFFAAIWPQAREGGDARPDREPVRFHYLKELFLDSATTLHGALVRPDLARRRQPAAAGRGGA